MFKVPKASLFSANTVIILVLCILVFAQGGFFGNIVCYLGFVLWIAALVLFVVNRRKNLTFSAAPLFFCLIAVLYLLSTLVVSPTSTSMVETATWFAVAGFSFVCWQQDADERWLTIRLVAWAGVVTALLGFAVQSGVIVLPNGMYGDRLQFTFQYANVAAIWFGSTGLLCTFARPGALKALAPLPYSAMLLCMSGGATVAFAVVLIVAIVVLAKRGRDDDMAVLLVQLLLAGALFALLNVVPAPVCLAFPIVWLAACVLSKRAVAAFDGRSGIGKPALIVFACILLAASIALSAAYSDRLNEAIGTFGIRLVYDMDAINALTSHALLGIGPDMWQYEYPHFQSAQYTTTVIHCSYLQTAADAGLLAALVLVAVLIVGLHDAWAGFDECPGGMMSLLLIALHSVVDFDMQFAVVAMLAALFATKPGLAKGELGDKTIPVIPAAIPVAVSVACALLCGWGFIEAHALSKVKEAENSTFAVSSSSGSGASGVDSLQFDSAQTPFLANDPAFYMHELREASNEGDKEKLLDLMSAKMVDTADEALTAFSGLCNAGEQDRAVEALLTELEKEPLNYRFHKEALQLAESSALGREDIVRVKEAVEQANEAAKGQNSLYGKKPKLVVID